MHFEKHKKTALLIVDMQKGVVESAIRLEEVVSNVNSLVAKARKENIPVVWIFHSDKHLTINSENWELISGLKRLDSENLIHKKYGDAFEDTNLESLLESLGVGRVIVAGAQTEACIRATIHGAFVRGYKTVLVGDAHTTEDMTNFGLPKPEILIDFTNVYWTFQGAQGRKGEVVNSGEINFHES